VKTERASVVIPALAVAVFGVMALSSLRVSYGGSPYDLQTFAELPVLNGGRTKPVDSVARNALLTLSGKQTVSGTNGSSTATEWLLDMAFNPAKADSLAVFEINDPDVLGLMNIQQTDKRRFSFNDLRDHLHAIEEQADRANKSKPEDRGRFETSVVNLYNRLILYQKLQNTLEASGTPLAMLELDALERRVPEILKQHADNPKGSETFMKEVSFFLKKNQFMERAAEFYPLVITGKDGIDWISPGRAGLLRMSGGDLHPAMRPIAQMGDAYRAADIAGFNEAVKKFSDISAALSPGDAVHARHETLFNHAQPFYNAMIVYLVAFLAMVISWLAWPKTLHRTAVWLVSLAFVIHTVGLFSRMILQGRPPVTNLYSSAIFVGWTAVLLGMIVERFYRNGLSTVVASLIGFTTLIIAHHLAAQGDTLEMMRAVLDSNFWLATHVVSITIGYSSTFLAGFLAATYLVRRLGTAESDEKLIALERMVYGVVCFSTFFSFVGTILGGIWADQSWGRFWGWDPKENGALMIVLWNSFVLHARWGRATSERSLMALVVFGNIVTALSWFGVNMLGIGLHSYGFMDKAFLWLMVFCASQLVVMALTFVPAGALRRRAARMKP
jgi:ABC-type transport system involved in cytochrome c biogenesis permease subunit